MEAIKREKAQKGKITDKEVVQRVLSGEKQLFEILMRRYNQTLYRVIRSYLRSQQEAEDAMQETYISAYQKLYQYKGDASFSTWLLRIGINEALLRIRKHKGSIMRNINDEVEDKIVRLPGSSHTNPEAQAIVDETRRLLEKAVDRLPEKYRIIYVMREVEGMENPEIAKCLSLSDSNVKVRLHRAKKLLRDELFRLSSDTAIFEFGDSRCDRLVNRIMKAI